MYAKESKFKKVERIEFFKSINTDIIIKIFLPFLLSSKDTFLFIEKFLLQIDISGIECNRHLCRKTTVFSCHRCLQTLVLEIKNLNHKISLIKSKFCILTFVYILQSMLFHFNTFSVEFSIISRTLKYALPSLISITLTCSKITR